MHIANKRILLGLAALTSSLTAFSAQELLFGQISWENISSKTNTYWDSEAEIITNSLINLTAVQSTITNCIEGSRRDAEGKPTQWLGCNDMHFGPDDAGYETWETDPLTVATNAYIINRGYWMDYTIQNNSSTNLALTELRLDALAPWATTSERVIIEYTGGDLVVPNGIVVTDFAVPIGSTNGTQWTLHDAYPEDELAADLTGLLGDWILDPGESATFRIHGEPSTSPLSIDNVAVYGEFGVPPIFVDPAPYFLSATNVAATYAQPGVYYTNSVAGSAVDPNGGPITYSRTLDGPAWLQVAANGALSGTPSGDDVGENSFSIVAEDDEGLFATNALLLTVLPNAVVYLPDSYTTTVGIEDGARPFSATIDGGWFMDESSISNTLSSGATTVYEAMSYAAYYWNAPMNQKANPWSYNGRFKSSTGIGSSVQYQFTNPTDLSGIILWNFAARDNGGWRNGRGITLADITVTYDSGQTQLLSNVPFELNPEDDSAGAPPVCKGQMVPFGQELANVTGIEIKILADGGYDAYTGWKEIAAYALASDDTDGDGMNDAWETGFFGDLSQDGTGDWDGDGVIDLHEHLADTDPTDPLSLLQMEGLNQGGGSDVYTVQWQSVAGKTYRLLSTDHLAPASWITIRTGIAATAPQNTETVTNLSGQAYYRIELE